jgi:hypothetical protein
MRKLFLQGALALGLLAALTSCNGQDAPLTGEGEVRSVYASFDQTVAVVKFYTKTRSRPNYILMDVLVSDTVRVGDRLHLFNVRPRIMSLR